MRLGPQRQIGVYQSENLSTSILRQWNILIERNEMAECILTCMPIKFWRCKCSQPQNLCERNLHFLIQRKASINFWHSLHPTSQSCQEPLHTSTNNDLNRLSLLPSFQAYLLTSTPSHLINEPAIHSRGNTAVKFHK